MFDEHQRVIGRDNMARVYTFVLMTVQQQLHTVPDMMRDIDTNGDQSRFLWGFKIHAYDWIQENKDEVFEKAMDISIGRAEPKQRAKDLLTYFAGLPGLGLIKAGFICQLVFGCVGCLDTHNLKRFNINPSRFKASKFKDGGTRRRRELVEDYCDAVWKRGGCAALWNGWCEYVAMKQPNYYKDANAVSKMHLIAIGV